MRVRLGLHINGHGHEDMVRRYVDAVRPPFMKFLGDASDPGQMDYCRARGSKVIYRVVLGDEGISKDGIRHIIGRAAETAGHWDYLEFANEEMQGRDHGEEGQWDRLCRLMQDAMGECEKRGWKACILNTSVGQPELRITGKPRWERPESVAMLGQAAAGGHLVGAHEYYRPRPWHGIEGPPGTSDRTAWAFPGKAQGWWMLRVARTIAEWRALGIPLPGIVITESGRDANTGTPGFGKGWRDEPRTPDGDFADFMAGYCRHLSAWPEVLGAVDFGFSTSQPEKWGSFDLATNTANQFERMIEVMRPVDVPAPPPVIPPTPPPTTPPGGGMNTVETLIWTDVDKAHKARGLPFTPTNALMAAAKIPPGVLVPTTDELTVLAGGGRYVAQRFQVSDTGAVVVLYCREGEWSKTYRINGAVPKA